MNKAITDYNACVDYDIAYAVTRRDACKSLMLIPLRLCGLDAVVQTSLIEIPKDAEGLLLHCAAGIAACWHMRQGKDIHLAYEIVSWYIPILQGVLSSQSERYRQAAAKLLAQCFMLKGRLAPSCENSMQAAVYLQQAIDYGDITENPTIQAITRRTMATHYAFEENWTQVLDYSQAAESFLTSTNADPIVHSFVASGLAMGHAAHEKTRKEAAPWLTKAQKNFESCKIPSCMQYSQAILMNCEGWARQFSEDYRGAANIFDQNIAISNTLTLGRICALFDRVETEMLRWDQPRDMDLCVRLWKEATQGAIELRSEQKFNTAYAHYKSLLIAFPGEEAIKRLRRGLVHW